MVGSGITVQVDKKDDQVNYEGRIECMFYDHGVPISMTFRLLRTVIGLRDGGEKFYHPHPTFSRISLIREGDMEVKTEGRIFSFKRGDIILLPATQPFLTTYGPSRINAFHFYLYDHMGISVFDGTQGLPFLNNESLFHEISSSFDDQQVVRLQSLAFYTACQFCRSLTEHLRRRAEKTLKYGKLLEYVSAHLGPSLSINTLAGLMNMSRSALSKGFRRDMGVPLKTYLIYILMNKARELLNETDMTIGEVAYALGYNEPYYFHRVFKKSTGKTPREFRLANRLASRDG